MGKESVAYHGILLTAGGVLVTVDTGGMLARILGWDEKNFPYFI